MSKQHRDPVAYALERLQTFLLWIEEHRASFEALRGTDPEAAESELSNLKDATAQAFPHLLRLTELLLAGETISAERELPQWLRRADWLRDYVERMRQDGHGSGA
jgi:hypothetical protein